LQLKFINQIVNWPSQRTGPSNWSVQEKLPSSNRCEWSIAMWSNGKLLLRTWPADVRRFARAIAVEDDRIFGQDLRQHIQHHLGSENVRGKYSERRQRRPNYFWQPRFSRPDKNSFSVRSSCFVLDNGRYASKRGHHAENVFRHQAQRRREQDALPDRRLRRHCERKGTYIVHEINLEYATRMID